MVMRFIIRFLFVYPVLGLIWGGIIGIISTPEGYSPSVTFELGALFGCVTGAVFGFLTAWFTCPYSIKQVFIYPFLLTGVFSFLAALFGGEGAATTAWLLGMLGYIIGLSMLAARGTPLPKSETKIEE